MLLDEMLEEKRVPRKKISFKFVALFIVFLLVGVMFLPGLMKKELVATKPVIEVTATDGDKAATVATPAFMTPEQFSAFGELLKTAISDGFTGVKDKMSELAPKAKDDTVPADTPATTTTTISNAERRRVRQGLIDEAKKDYAEAHGYCSWGWLFALDLMDETKIFELENPYPFDYYDLKKDGFISVPHKARLFLYPKEIYVFECRLDKLSTHDIINGNEEETCKKLIEALQAQQSNVPAWYIDREYKKAHTKFKDPAIWN